MDDGLITNNAEHTYQCGNGTDEEKDGNTYGRFPFGYGWLLLLHTWIYYRSKWILMIRLIMGNLCLGFDIQGNSKGFLCRTVDLLSFILRRRRWRRGWGRRVGTGTWTLVRGRWRGRIWRVISSTFFAAVMLMPAFTALFWFLGWEFLSAGKLFFWFFWFRFLDHT